MFSNHESRPTLRDKDYDYTHYNDDFIEGDDDDDDLGVNDDIYFNREMYYETRFWRAVKVDNRPKFVSLVREWLQAPRRPKIDIFKLVRSSEAIDCAKALLDGVTDLSVDLNVPMENRSRRLYPLHYEAQNFRYDVVNLLLSYGARTDVTCGLEDVLYLDRPPKDGRRLLPLDAALESLENHLYVREWTPKDSIFKLVTILCTPPMKWPLETIRLLSSATKEVNEVFIYYVKEGRPIQVAVMLMVAKEYITFPESTLQSRLGSVIHGSIMGICESFMQLEESKLIRRIENMNGRKLFTGKSQSSELDKMFTGERAALNYVWTLLEVFEKAGDVIELYRLSRPSNVSKEGLVKDVATIFEKAGVFLEDKHIDMSKMDWDCFETEEAVGPIASRHQQLALLLLHPLEKPKPRNKTIFEQVDAKKKFSLFWFPSRSLPPSSSFSSFQSGSAFHTLEKTQFNVQTRSTDRCVLGSETRNLLAFFAGSLKRGTRRI